MFDAFYRIEYWYLEFIRPEVSGSGLKFLK